MNNIHEKTIDIFNISEKNPLYINVQNLESHIEAQEYILSLNINWASGSIIALFKDVRIKYLVLTILFENTKSEMMSMQQTILNIDKSENKNIIDFQAFKFLTYQLNGQ